MKLLLPVAALLYSTNALAAAPCELSQSDQAWVDRAMQAWDFASRAITGIPPVKRLQAVFFDERCVISSSTAMNGGPQAWEAHLHTGQIILPGGRGIPVSVISFAGGDDKTSFFTMSTPSVWRAAETSDAGLGSLETLMTVVLLHEATHVAQMPTYGERMTRLAERAKLPDDFNDDSIQKRFESNKEFGASVRREIDLLLGAATARNDATAARLAREARSLMKARQQRWYAGSDSHLREAEDIWLTLEGSAQWAAHQWLINPDGGAVDPRVAFGSFGWRGKWWSQNEGFALFMALDRLSGDRWKKHVFGDGAKTALELLDEAVAAKV